MSPLNILKKYLNAWKKKNYAEMYDLSQKTWKQQHKDRKGDDIFAFVGFKQLTSYKIGEPAEIGQCMIEYPVEIYYTVEKEKRHKLLNIRIIQELSPFTPSINGTWGINPTSGFKENDVSEK